MRAFGIAMAAALLASLTTLGITQAVGSNAPVSLSSAIAANTAQIRACANRETGDLRLLSSGKCTKAEQLVVWSRQGPRGPAGSDVVVVDGKGQRFRDGVVDAYFMSYFRVIGGMIWHYLLPSGELKRFSMLPVIYLGSECAGTPYGAYTDLFGPDWQEPRLGLSGQGYRLDPSATPISPRGSDLVVLAGPGGCGRPTEAGEVGGLEFLQPMVPVDVPPDMVGPVRLAVMQ